jgi:hypothetical protein
MERVQTRNGIGHAHQIERILRLIDFLPPFAKTNGLFVLASVSFATFLLCVPMMPQNL